MKRLALTLFTLALAHAASAEQFYKWQDPSGAWHYSKEPPKEKQSQAVVVNTGAGSSAVESQATAAPPPAAEPAKPDDAKSGEPTVANAETLKQIQEANKARSLNCERAKTNAATLESYTSVTVQRNGADVTLNDEERAAELKRARQQVDTFCK